MTMSDNQENTALTTIPASALPTILAHDKQDILGKLAAKVAAFKADVSTPDGKAAIRSLAYEVAQTKTALIKIGKGLTEEWRASTKAVNAECNLIEARMDELRDAVRAPLTALENAEKDRVARHEASIVAAREAAQFDAGWQVRREEIQERLESLARFDGYDWQEFQARGAATVATSIATLTALREDIVKREAEAAELARLRVEQAERDRVRQEQERAEREARIAAEAAENARRQAEIKAEQEKFAAAAALARAQREAEEAEQRAQAAIAQAAKDRAAAELRAEQERDAAIQAERRRVEAEAAAQAKEDARRAADREHRSTVNRAAMAAIISEASCGEAIAMAVVKAIAKGAIPHVTINY